MAKQTSRRAKSISLTDSVKASKLLPRVSALNEGQKNLLKAIASVENHIVMVDGIAGTGKSFCAASWGLEHLLRGEFSKLIVTRPVVEAGERLGFLPGSFESKLSPYLIPIMDIFSEHISSDDIKDLFTEEKIITLPLAFMRGTTFKRAFVLLDEAQNTTVKQMHLFLTRIGQGTKVVITGDGKQSDLGPDNGFVDALRRLQGIKGLEIVTLDPKQVVRHSIISEIDERYSVDKQ